MCGCARILRGYMVSSYEDIPLWHERDISHSSAERIMLPDATILLDYMLNRFGRILENLVVFPDNMLKHIYMTHKVIFAQRVMTALINKGFAREAAYDLVQPIAMKAWFDGLDYQELLLQNETIRAHFTPEELAQCFTLEYYMKEVPTIFERVFGKN